MSFIVVLGVLMFNSNTDALVDNDYYEKGLNYDKDYNRKEQVKIDDAAPIVKLTEDNIILRFKNKAEGNIKLLRNSDKRMDKNIALSTDATNEVKIPLQGIEKGQWRLIISWTTEGLNYLNEQEILIK